MKRIVTMLMVLVMLVGVIPVSAEAGSNVTVYVSVSRYGELVHDKDGAQMAYAEINLSGKENYNLNDVFLATHGMFHEEGEAAYASSATEWGFGIDRLWGDDSYNFGYQVNLGTAPVKGLDYIVEDGDYIDACIYKNQYPDTEGYAIFDRTHAEIDAGSELELNLTYFSGYDENWNQIISPCEGATITINGEETEFITDESGNVCIKIENEERSVISATKKKILNEKEVPAITAPVCVVEVNENPSVSLIHNIAESYIKMDFSQNDVNLPWIIADMMIYEELFPDSPYVLHKEQKQSALCVLAEAVKEAENPGDLAKYILALRALGYDARRVYTKNLEALDAVKKLKELVASEDERVINIYTLPYVMLALAQDETYAETQQMQWILQAVMNQKTTWQNVEYGTDALTPMLLALAPYAGENTEIKNVLDETVEILKSEQREDGLIDGFEGYEPASTGLAICALSALGIDADSVKKADISLVSGLVSVANEDLSGFSNAFATEQGFRGLLAWRLLMENKEKMMYDFSEYAMEKANAAGITYCPVVFEVSPTGATIRIQGEEAFLNNCFDLPEGQYTYTASASGYKKTSAEFEVTAEEAAESIVKRIEISLTKKSVSGGADGTAYESNEKPVQEKKPEIKEEKNIDAEKENKKAGMFLDVSQEDWYYSAVQYVYENELFNGTDRGFEPQVFMTRGMFVTVLQRLDGVQTLTETIHFSDVPEQAWYAHSVAWAAEKGIVKGLTEAVFAPEQSITREQLAVILYRYALYKGYKTDAEEDAAFELYGDKASISAYAMDAMHYMHTTGIIKGRSSYMLAPGECVTRAEVAAMLMRFAEMKG